MSSPQPQPDPPAVPEEREPAHRPPRPSQAARWFDYGLCTTALAVTAYGVWSVAGELVFQLQSPGWNTMWESGPLQVAIDASRGRPIYSGWHDGPVHLAIYGYLYHAVLAVLAWVTGGDPGALTASARWLSIVSLGIAMLAAIRYVRLAGAPTAAALIAPICLLLLARTGIRFLASARPDGMAAMFSLLALLTAFGSGRISILLTILLLSAAWHTKMSSIAALLAIIVVLVFARRYGRAAWLAGGTWALSYAVLLLMDAATAGAASQHLFAPSAAPMRLDYLKLMLTSQRGYELMLLVALPLLALLVSLRAKLPVLDDSVRSRAATVYLLVAWAVALGSGLHQGSDLNYLIEPTLATGIVLGIFAGRLGRARSRSDLVQVWLPRTVGAIALAACIVLLLPYRTHRFSQDAREERAMRNAYTPQALAWARQLPQPLLSLDSWLTYEAGVANDLNDSIAYLGLLHDGGRDAVAHRAEERRYAAIVVFGDIADRGVLWGDIPRIWPALRRAVETNYAMKEKHGAWAVYVPTNPPAEPEEVRDEPTQPQATRIFGRSSHSSLMVGMMNLRATTSQLSLIASL